MTPTVQKSWYILLVFSGFEERVAQQLKERLDKSGKLAGTLIPTEEVIEMRGGKRVRTERMLYPGYLLAELEMSDDLWHAIRRIPRVTGFAGGKAPVPLTATEVNEILARQSTITERPRIAMQFEKGETIRIVEGPFSNFTGMVDEVNRERATLRALVTIFGRETPVELDFLQVEKL